MKLKSKHIILTLVLFVTGLLLSVSFQLVQDGVFSQETIDETDVSMEERLQQEILEEQEANLILQEELSGIQAEISAVEEELGDQETTLFNVIEDVDRLRMLTGVVPVKGPGLTVTLTDADFIPGEDNPNHYIVHEYHIQKVVDELLIAGAEAVSINGQRLSHDSYIQCVGPVIEVDGHVSFAPFEISVIGDSQTLLESLKLPGGVMDSLLEDQIQVRTQIQSEITIRPRFEQGEAS